ncbi:MAG: hypothetical protein AAB906_02145 [Patescibacteria group bacterium]
MDDYKTVISDIIKKQIEVVGPTIALAVARKVPAIKLAQDGTILEIIGDQKIAFEQVAEAYISFSGEISKMILKSVMKSHPDVKINHL